ncbi:thioesterase [Chromatium weissei]|nr:thioesterase [Chromatium weissei]
MLVTPFIYSFTLRLHDTDAAGRLFFAHLFRHAHDAFEHLMTALGTPLETMIRDGQTLLPLIHAEADYHQPLHHGDCVQVQVTITEIRRRSFALHYVFLNQRHEIAATAHTVHCQINADGSAAEALAPTLRTAFTRFHHSAIT